MAQGHTNAAIARALVVTEATVGEPIRSLFDKLDLPPTPGHHRRVLAVLTHLEGGRRERMTALSAARPPAAAPG